MSRFSVENAAFTNLWGSDQSTTILSITLNEFGFLWNRPRYYSTSFADGEYIPTNEKGVASFTVQAEIPVTSTVMDMRAPLGEGQPMEAGESMEYSGSIKGFIAPTWKQTATARDYQEKLMAKYGSDAAILKGFATNELAPRINAGYQTLDYIAMKAESTLKARYDIGRGLTGNIYAIPTEYQQKEKAGAKVWTDPAADILASVMDIQDKKWKEWGVELPMQLKVTKKFFRNVIMKNPGVIKTLKTNWLTDQGQLAAGVDSVSNWVVNEENFNKYVVGSIPNFPKLTIVDSEMLIDRQTVDPWTDGIAVLCPLGYAGRILRTDSLDEEIYTKYGNNACSFAFSRTADGLMLVMNSLLPNGSLTERQMKVVMDACPVITDFQYRVLIDTKTANS